MKPKQKTCRCPAYAFPHRHGTKGCTPETRDALTGELMLDRFIAEGDRRKWILHGKVDTI
jgi:hypothetical protein